MKLFKSRKGHNLKMHIMIALVVLIALWYLNQTYKWIDIAMDSVLLLQLLAIGIIYSVMPDSDQPGSIINKWLTIALVSVIIYSFYNPAYQNYGIMSALILGLLRVIEHRTLIHSVLGALIILFPLYLYFGLFHFIVGMVAFISHIVSDNDFSWGWERDHRW